MPTKKTPAQKPVQFLPLAKLHDNLTQATYQKRYDQQRLTMSSALKDQYSLVIGRFKDEILYGIDCSAETESFHLEFELVECGRVHIDLTIQGFASVRKFGGGSDFLPFVRPTIQFTGAYDAAKVGEWLIQAVLDLRASVQAYHFGKQAQQQ